MIPLIKYADESKFYEAGGGRGAAHEDPAGAGLAGDELPGPVLCFGHEVAVRRPVRVLPLGSRMR